NSTQSRHVKICRASARKRPALAYADAARQIHEKACRDDVFEAEGVVPEVVFVADRPVVTGVGDELSAAGATGRQTMAKGPGNLVAHVLKDMKFVVQATNKLGLHR